jgi:hypothetical protein
VHPADTIQTRFAESNWCPKERVPVKVRPDLQLHGPDCSIYEKNPVDDPPPPDVAGDPERLQMWNSSHAQQTNDLIHLCLKGRDAAQAEDIYEAQGCDHQAFYTRRQTLNGRFVDLQYVTHGPNDIEPRTPRAR